MRTPRFRRKGLGNRRDREVKKATDDGGQE